MRLHLATSLLVLLAVPACEKAKDLLAKAKPAASKPAASAASAASMPAVQDLDAAEYDGFIATPGHLMVVDFHADWCGPCKVLGPVLEQVAGEFPGKVSIGKVNVDHAQQIAQREGVSGIPDVRLFRDGKEVDRFVGGVSADKLRALFQKHSEDLQVAKAEKPAADPQAPAAPAEPAIQPMKKDWLPPGIERR
ncbi:thioredoxin domain-containing protein [Luteolibacter arcticus]|uniref:Thioredoxin domain-containing protein n=1 Tax=Luteolibacter arcticus TaxID=1581411 RepID=A0ABT3GGS9_9BACT|nr:thioredoxin domain-containing protein [Luteolibacter arcticus]MCW1922473.1 thioredoxin domain-containing protein [Luteolibacter arcticus]